MRRKQTPEEKRAQASSRFRHLPSRLGQEPTPAEEELFTAARAHLAGVSGTLPRFLLMPDLTVVAVIDNRNAEGQGFVGLAVELAA